MNKGRAYGIPGIGLAGDWPGGWTQTYAQLDTEAGPHGFDKDYFVQQVAGLSQLAGEFMLVKPIVIDLGWGNLKSALVNLPDSGFVAPRKMPRRNGRRSWTNTSPHSERLKSPHTMMPRARSRTWQPIFLPGLRLANKLP